MPTDQDELFELLGALCSGTITPAEHERLEVRLAADRSARQLYFDYIDMHLHLRQWQRAEGGKNDECGMMKDELPATAASDGIHHSSFINHHSDFSPLIPPIIIDTSPAPALGACDWLFSYGASAVIMGIALLPPGCGPCRSIKGGPPSRPRRHGRPSRARSRSAGSPAWPIACGLTRTTLRGVWPCPGRQVCLGLGPDGNQLPERREGDSARPLHL